MKRYKIFISLVVLVVMFLCVDNKNVFATLDATGTLTQADSFTVPVTQGDDPKSSYFKLDLTIEGKQYKDVRANCCAHNDDTPDVGTKMTGKVYFPGDNGYNRKVAIAMYYGYWGDGSKEYKGTQDVKHRIIATSWAISYLTRYGTPPVNSIEMWGWDFSEWLVKKINGTDNAPKDLAYFIVCPPAGSDRQCLGGIINVVQDGELVIEKIDNYDKPKQGAKFWVEGPDDFEPREIITNEKGIAKLEKIPLGKYTIREIEAPENMVLINVSKSETLTAKSSSKKITFKNVYQRGAVRLVKYDKNNRNNTKGDAELEGAVFELYAAENIKEGEKSIYSKDELIKSNIITDKNGDTQAVSNLPIGNYYYKEVKASKGFKINKDIIPVKVEYKAGDEYSPEGYCECPEEEITVDIKIIKKLKATSYEAETYLDGAQFSLTLINDPTQVYTTTVSEINGICVVYGVPYGEYKVSEIKVPTKALKADDFNILVVEDKDTPYEYEVKDEPKTMKIEIYKSLIDKLVGRTDAQIKGAYFTVYKDPSCAVGTEYKDMNNKTVVIGPTDERGYAISGEMLTGTYYIKETVFPKGINPNAKIPGENVTYKDKIYVASKDTMSQTTRTVTLTFNIDNMASLGNIKVIKYDDNPDGTEESPAKGAILRLTLDSNPNCYYDATIGKNGDAEFINPLMEEYYPYTIPYGKYTITEIKPSDGNENTRFFMRPESVSITSPNQVIKPIVIEDPLVQLHIKVVKKDEETNKEVAIAGAKFKIWDCKKGKFVEQRETPGQDMVTEFSTNAQGEFYTPNTLDAGEYIIYEVAVPKKGFKGYYLEDKYRLPEKESDYGKKNGQGKLVSIDKSSAGIRFDAAKDDPDVKKYIEVEVIDRPLKGKIKVIKKGLMLTEIKQEFSYEYGEIKTPIYEERGLQGVTYEIYAAEEITSVDETEQKIPENGYCGKIVTGKDGIGISEELYLGKYYLKEVDAPAGTLLNPERIYVEVLNEDPLERVKTTEISLTNKKQKAELQIPKIFGEIRYILDEIKEKYAIFGVYANEQIKNCEGNVVINKDDLLDIIKVDEQNLTGKSTADLPQGKYYYKEIFVTDPYVIDKDKYEFTVEYDKSNNPKVEIKGQTVVNEPDTSMLYLIKLSASSFYKDEIIVGTDGLDSKIIEEKSLALAYELKNMTRREIELYLRNPENRKISLSGAKYAIYLDKDCKKPLKEINKKGELVNVVVTTNEYGMASLENIPLGLYYLKEIEAPENYKIAQGVAMIELTQDDKNVPAYRILCDEMSVGYTFEKVDIFTGENVPNCTFEIKDKDGNVIIRLKTNEKGEAEIKLDLLTKGETYTYTEIDAPDIYKEDGKLYKLNTEPHEFVCNYEIVTDENGKKEIKFNNRIKVENYRPTSDVTLEKLDFADSTPIPNCKFELRSLETDFVVEGVTDENGIYVFKNIPYGKYTYTELEAPEEYIIDTEPHEIEINAKDMKIKVTNEKAPDTGDLEVYITLGVFVLSLTGIVYLNLRKRINQV